MPHDLRELIKRCLAGHQDAMHALVQHYQSQVFGLCYRMLGSREDAEDATQETFVRVFKSLERWDSSRDFDPWLLAIAGNRCRTMLVRRSRRPTSTPLVDHLPDRTPDMQAAQNLAEEVNLALEDLRDEYRQAFLLFHEQELSYAEIGAALECPVGTVKTWVHRARRELIERLARREVVSEVRHGSREISAAS
ncbi:MAG: sigma-70 family RNA polymerase sigma factor [Pirellulales bacterium]|nr:sigma-70 family RNA polymerase sigma factor [Pirellulales bacterium]